MRILKRLMSNKQIHAQIIKSFNYIHIVQIFLTLSCSAPAPLVRGSLRDGQGAGGQRRRAGYNARQMQIPPSLAGIYRLFQANGSASDRKSVV